MNTSDFLQQIASCVIALFEVAFSLAGPHRRRDLAKTVRVEHCAVYAAIAARDPEGARQAALNHINNAVERLKSADPSFWQNPGARTS